MQDKFRVPQLLLRLAIGVTFLTPVADRLGLLGSPGTGNIEWGNWENFISYTATLMPVFNATLVQVMGVMATIAELLTGLLLIVGFQTRLAALSATLVTMTFIIFMTLSVGIQKPINYGVFTASAAGLLLSALPGYRWSLDNLLDKRKRTSNINA